MTSSIPDVQNESAEDDFFSPEDQLDLLRSNHLALVLGTVQFLQRRGIPGSDWASELGAMFATGWDTDEVWSAEDFLDATIINLSVLGGEVHQSEFAEDEASAAVSYLPDFERLEGMDLDNVGGDAIYDMISPIAQACGLTWFWEREGEVVRVRVTSRKGDE